MTTRRRRTASETGCDEPPLTGRTASILPVSQAEAYNPLTCNLQPPGNLSWNSPIQTDAVYKKTDVAANSPGFQNRGFQPQQIINYPTNFNNTRTTNNSFNSNYSSPYSVQPSVNLDYAPPPTNSFSHSSFGSSNDNNPFWVSDVKEIENMASRDRTQEFARIIRSQQGNLVNGAFPYKEGRKPKDYRQYAEFMQRAKLIGRNISSTYAKLEKLTHLAKKRSLFDDSQDQEIQELTGIIRHDLTSLTKQLEELQNRSRLSNSQLNGSSGQLQKHSANLVGSLQTKVASITQKFRDVLEVRTESLKKQAERREQYAGGGISGELPPQAVAGHHQGSVLMKEEAAAAAATRNRPPSLGRAGDFSIDMGSD
ncbi:UNVERIFIED_CONTAM: hypothetical protein GTU68_051512, partial [Idotea baltica]|nr:hypothetical protein [Idotea baltica]